MKITIVAFEGCMTSAVYGQADAFAIAAYISGRRADGGWSGHDVRIATPGGVPVPCRAMADTSSSRTAPSPRPVTATSC
jgi:hypothetical protein